MSDSGHERAGAKCVPGTATAAQAARTREPAQFAFSLFLVTGLLFILFVLYGVVEQFLLSDPNR